MQSRWVLITVSMAAILALCVVMLGAYTRLTNAGLGCPDWPGCYGHLILPKASGGLSSLQQQYPHIEMQKAWTEMAHRYAAGTLALLIFLIAYQVLSLRLKGVKISWLWPAFLILLVVFQAALGMWTVTMKLLPVVVMGHLLGGILIFASLCRLGLQLTRQPAPASFWHWAAGLGVIILFCQIALGGWVSANYAGIACMGFPQCNAQWFPSLHFSAGFNLFSPVGANYQGGVLDNDVRASIAFIHRLGAMITAVYILSLSVALMIKTKNTSLRVIAFSALFLIIAQFTLGVINVVYLLPLAVAVAHNGVAALLMATMLMMFYLTKRSEHHVHS